MESDWRDYYGSNKHLQEDVKKMGEDFFHREILHICKTKGECAYMEAKEQFDREVRLCLDLSGSVIDSQENFFVNLSNKILFMFEVFY